ncbi:hypothetical protein [Butyrivibrio sp. MC2021]|uniref:hypothetical protein n=1 Tax=Butyrivibrio sp. MC2021 TaxID=1408306 RepID=UPI0012DEB76D|nr:hypothetical protein [Butyrivibrio sp. MC2021]
MFSIEPTKCKSNAMIFDNAQNELRNYSAEIESLRGQIATGILTSAAIDVALKACADLTLKRAVETQNLGNQLVIICNTYSKAEQNIMGNISKADGKGYTTGNGNGNGTGAGGACSPNPGPFDVETGEQYGGKQHGPMNATGDEKDDLYDLVRKYHPELTTDQQVADYLTKLNSEGCGYVAIANTIFEEFKGKEDLFKQKFGFDMYKPDGTLNYNMLITDIYASTDNHNASWFFGIDTYKPGEDSSATQGWGTTEAMRKYRTELYLRDKGVSVKVDNSVQITPENFHNYDDGHIILQTGNFHLIDPATGNPLKDPTGEHAMTVTGFTDDGLIIVSSWGKKYYIDPNESGCKFDYAYFKYDIKDSK